MNELHTPVPWDSEHSTEDYQGHVIFGSRTVAATYTEEPTEVTQEDAANMSLIVTAPVMLQALRQIARVTDFRQEDGAMELGQRLIDMERVAETAIAAYEFRLLQTEQGET
jgi:hypothetical protein